MLKQKSRLSVLKWSRTRTNEPSCMVGWPFISFPTKSRHQAKAGRGFGLALAHGSAWRSQKPKPSQAMPKPGRHITSGGWGDAYVIWQPIVWVTNRVPCAPSRIALQRLVLQDTCLDGCSGAVCGGVMSALQCNHVADSGMVLQPTQCWL
jgi:hypothetical protein